MRLVVEQGDIRDQAVDVLLCGADGHLSMSDDVSKSILQRGGATVEEELQAHLAGTEKAFFAAGSVVRTGGGSLSASYLFHLVVITAFNDSTVELVAGTIRCALLEAGKLSARTVALPRLAIGSDALSTAEFGYALRQVLDQGPYQPIEEVRVVLARESDVYELGF